MAKVPEDPTARRAFLKRWAREQQRKSYASEIARVVAQAQQRTGQLGSLRGVAAIPVVITKPSDLPADRAAVFADLMVGVRENKWAEPIVSECNEWRYIAPNAIDLARRHCPRAPWLLYMEDDVILGPDFGLIPELLREADELFPHAGIVSFWSVRANEPGWSIHPMNEFFSTQCFAIRNTDHLLGFRAFIDAAMPQSAEKQSRTKPGSDYEQQDFALKFFLATQYGAYAVWCPSLVQHANVISVTWGHINTSISWSYECTYG